MNKYIVLVLLVVLVTTINAQDLQLGVHVLPTSVIGDPAMFNITVRNTEEETARNVSVQVNLHPGIAYSSHSPTNADFDPETGIWQVGDVNNYKAATLGVIVTIKTREDAILEAEVASCTCTDPDSTPGNGVDTNGNGKIVHDKGDEDDGDAAQNGPFN